MIIERLMLMMSADSSKFTKEMEKSAAKLEKFERQVKKANKEFLKIGAAVAGFGALMVREASKYDRDVAKSVDKLEGAFADMAVAIGRELIPVVDALTGVLQRVTGFTKNAHKNWEAFKHALTDVTFIKVIISAFDLLFDHYTSRLSKMIDTLSSVAAIVSVVYRVPDLSGTLSAMAETIRDMGQRGIGGMVDDAVAGFKEMGRALDGIAPKEAISGRHKLAGLEVSESGKADSFIDKFRAGMDSSGGGMTALQAVRNGQEQSAFQKSIDENMRKMVVDSYPQMISRLTTMIQDTKELANLQRFEGRNSEETVAKLKELVEMREDAQRAHDEANTAGVAAGFGTAGGIAQTISATAAGGPIGALFAALAPLIAPLQKLLEAVISMVATILDALAPALDPLTSLFVLLGNMFRAMMPALKMIVLLATPFNALATIALPPLFYALKAFGIVALFIAKQLQTVWNAVFSAFEWIVLQVANLAATLKLKGLANGLIDVAYGIDKMKVTEDIGQALRDMVAMSLHDAMTEPLTDAINSEVDARVRSTQSLEQFNQTLSNTPTGFKLASYQYAAQAAEPAGATMIAGGIARAAGDDAYTQVNVYLDSQQIAAATESAKTAYNFKRTGKRYGGSTF